MATYDIHLTGQADIDDVRGVFEDSVRALRAIAEQGSDAPSGMLSAEGTNGDGTVETLEVSATDVSDAPAADTTSGS